MLIQIVNLFVSSVVIYNLCAFVVTILFGVLACKLLLWNRFHYWKLRNIEQVPPQFPCGNFQDVFLQRKSIGEFLIVMYKFSMSKITGFYIFHMPHLLVRCPDLIKQVLVSDFTLFHDRPVASDERADPLLSKVLLLVKNPEWKIMRHKTTPFFTSSKIRGMSTLVVKSCGDLIEYLDDHHQKGPLEAKELCAKFTTDVITSCAFGIEAGSFLNDDAPFREAGRRMFDTTFMNGVRFMCYFLLPAMVKIFRVPLLDRSTTYFLRDAFLQAISHRESTSGRPRGDLIDIIIELKKNKEWPGGIMFEGDRVAQAIQFFAAGFETTSATISFALYELALQPNIQDEVRQSVVDLVKNGEQINYDTMLKLPRLERILLETLRKYPSGPFLVRRCNKDFSVENSDIIIPKGTPISIPIMALHYDEEYFPNPHQFDPDRFLPENVKNRHAFVYLPFGQGPRNCIGERFAMNAMKIFFAHLLLRYKVEPCARTPTSIEFSPKSFVLIASKGVPLSFIKLKTGVCG